MTDLIGVSITAVLTLLILRYRRRRLDHQRTVQALRRAVLELEAHRT